MKIGQVVKLLSEEYPSVSISRIRFLEKEGLIKINRTKGGTRELTDNNITTLKNILNLQQKHYVTLKAIKNNPSILTNNNEINVRKSYTLTDALKNSGLSKKIYNDLFINLYIDVFIISYFLSLQPLLSLFYLLLYVQKTVL